LAHVVLDDRRWYYAFRDVEIIRHKMLSSEARLDVQDFGAGASRTRALAEIARRAASSARQGRQLFRLANWANPATILELGTAVGIGALYLQSGARSSRLITLEGSPALAAVARANLDALGFQNQLKILSGPFENNLQPALDQLQVLDFAYFDGNHRQAPTLAYFEKCLGYAQAKTVFVFDDVHWSEDMEAAWQQIQQHPRVTLTVDFWDLSLVFINPDFKQVQHLKIVPSSWKIWKFL
jgi:predicted O-methyltransferase YrrM